MGKVDRESVMKKVVDIVEHVQLNNERESIARMRVDGFSESEITAWIEWSREWVADQLDDFYDTVHFALESVSDAASETRH